MSQRDSGLDAKDKNWQKAGTAKRNEAIATQLTISIIEALEAA